MKLAHAICAALLLVSSAQAQDRGPREIPTQGLRGKTMENCKADIQRLCETARLKQECLVAHWTKLSGDCQDGLATPMRGGGE